MAASDAIMDGRAPAGPCALLRGRVCVPKCSAQADHALKEATAEQCQRWMKDPGLVRALSHNRVSELPQSCDRLLQAACEIAPTLCVDMRSVLPLGTGTTHEGKQCERIIGSPQLMAQLAGRLSRIAFAAAHARTKEGGDDP